VGQPGKNPPEHKHGDDRDSDAAKAYVSSLFGCEAVQKVQWS